MMNGFNVFMEKHIVPFAVKLNEQRHVAAIRDAYVHIPNYNGCIVSYFN